MTVNNLYPDRFIFNREIDEKENIYKKAYSNILTDCIVCINGKNIHCKGRLNLFTRKGKSKFGEELGIYFKIEAIVDSYKSESVHNVVEVYLPKEKGIDFLTQALTYIKK